MGSHGSKKTEGNQSGSTSASGTAKANGAGSGERFDMRGSYLADLQGTEKQIRYAQDIRDGYIADIEQAQNIAYNPDAEKYEISRAEGYLRDAIRALDLDASSMGRPDFQDKYNETYNNLISQTGDAQYARAEMRGYTTLWVRALTDGQTQAAKAGETREQRNAMREQMKRDNMIRVADAVAARMREAAQNETSSEWWIDRKR